MKFLGPYIRPSDQRKTVDHINGDKTDDRIENLQILSRQDNARKSVLQIEEFWCECPMCKKLFTPSKHQRNSRARLKAGPFCSRKCSGQYGAALQNKMIKPINNSLPLEFIYTSEDGKQKITKH